MHHSSRLNYRRRIKLAGFLFVLPALLFFACFSVYPILNALYESFFHDDLFSPLRFVGLRNYRSLAHDATFLNSLLVTGYYVLLVGPASWVLGLALALLLKGRLFGRGLFRSLFFMPSIFSGIGVAVSWQLLLRPAGPIDVLLGHPIAWLTQSQTAMPGIALMGIWQGMGWFMVVFLAGLQAIPDVYYEAAKVDGAGALPLLWHITLPLLRPVFAFVVVNTIIGGMTVFTPMYIMTGGGPSNSTQSLVMLIYETGIHEFSLGLADAMVVVMFLLLLVLTLVQLRLFRSHEEGSQ